MPLEYGFWLLLALVLAHAGAAFRHHIFQGDDTLRHMHTVPRRADPPVLRRVDQGDATPGALKQPAARCSTYPLIAHCAGEYNGPVERRRMARHVVRHSARRPVPARGGELTRLADR